MDLARFRKRGAMVERSLEALAIGLRIWILSWRGLPFRLFGARECTKAVGARVQTGRNQGRKWLQEAFSIDPYGRKADTPPPLARGFCVFRERIT